MPVVMVLSKPYGFPIAITWSPISRLDELAMPRGTRGLVRFSTIFKTARSLNGSLPATDAVYLFPSGNVTSKTFALLTTWLLVIMCPWVSYIKPEPNAVTFWPSPGLEGSAGGGGEEEDEGGAGTLLVIWTTE